MKYLVKRFSNLSLNGIELGVLGVLGLINLIIFGLIFIKFSDGSSENSMEDAPNSTAQCKLLNLIAEVSTLSGTRTRGALDDDKKASFYEPRGITSDGSNLYIADTLNNKIRKIVIATGVTSTLVGSEIHGSIDRPSGISTDGTNLYVTDGNEKIRKIEISTGEVTTIAGGASGFVDGIGAGASFNQPRGITINSGNLYVADSRNNKIRKIEIATGVVSTFAGSGFKESNDGIGTVASFNEPVGITNDGDNLYVADGGGSKIRKIVIATEVVSTIAGSSAKGDEDRVGAFASFVYPSDITTDGISLYITDTYNCIIRKLDIATGKVTTFAGRKFVSGKMIMGGNCGRVDGASLNASFYRPEGITIVGGNLFVADTHNHNIRKIAIETGVVTTFSGSIAGETNAGSTDGPSIAGSSASFNESFGITTDGINLYVADTINNKIRKIVIATGVVTTLAGSGMTGSIDATDKEATFNGPFGVATDRQNLYVADTINNKIRKIVIASGVVTTLAGSGAAGSVNASGTSSSFSHPVGLSIEGKNLYVADTYNHSIRKIVIETGVVTTLAGTGKAGSVDGTGTSASFNYPFGITTDGNNLYVADTHNHTIRKIVISSGMVTTIAGSGTASYVDGLGKAASFNFPNSITIDGCNLYVADTSNHSIRKIVIETGKVTTLAGSGAAGLIDAKGTLALFNYPRGITTDGKRLYVADTDNHTIRQIR